jgi:glycosyltransferase involved in cell wall biosynthesis
MPIQQKNILIVTHHYPPHITGVGFVAQNHANRLAALGYNVTVITSDTGPQEKSYTADGVEVVRIKAWNVSETWGAPFPIFSPMLLPAIFKYVRRADIVHIHDAFYISSFWTAFVARMYRKPILLTQHVAMIAHPTKLIVVIEKIVYATTGALIFRWSNKILTYNERVERFLVSRGVDKNKMSVLLNGVDTEFFHPVSLPEKMILRREFGLDLDKKIILFVGRFVPKKGLDKVLAVGSEEYQIVCAGGDIPKEGVDNIKFLGKLGQKTLARAYQAADIFLLPSESEGFPLSIQEAMASGLAIIATNDPGYEQYGFDKELIYFLDRLTEPSIRSAIQHVIQTPSRLESMGAYSRSYAEAHFSWSLRVSQLEKIYEDLLAPQKKKIAVVSDAIYPFNKGGKEKRLYDITTRLAAQGYEVTIYCMKWWKGEDVIVEDGVTLHAISPYYPLYANNRRSITEAIFFALHCFKLLNKDFDVIEVDHMPHTVLFTMKIVCLLKGKKMIATWHEVWGKGYWNDYLGAGGTFAYWVEKLSAQLPDTIIAVSSHTARNLRSTLETKREILMIPNGLDIGPIANIDPAPADPDILFAGRLLSHKNVDVLLRAMRILAEKDPNISLTIVGEGPEKENLEKLTDELGIRKNVSFVDFFTDHNDLYRTMHASKVFVLPSTREGFGISVIEANASGLPVVTIDHEQNAAKELIVDGENGVLSALDEVSLANAILKALQMKKDRMVYTRYTEKYNWDNIVPEIKKAYGL